MADGIDGNAIRKVLLEVVKEQSEDRTIVMSPQGILQEAIERLERPNDIAAEQAILTLFYDLFRNGHLAWGLNISNPAPPFCHVTDQGRKSLAHLSRDPANPDGYLEHLRRNGGLNSIASSYMEEALTTYNAACFKAAAVMIGTASESVILELRDEVANEISSLSKSPSKKLMDWRIKTVLDQLKVEFDAQKGNMPKPIAERLDANWSAFTQQIRAARNDAGHPNSIDPITPDTVHASLLIFPELARLSADLKAWIPGNFV